MARSTSLLFSSLIFTASLLDGTLYARISTPPTDAGGRPLVDDSGNSVNYDSAPANPTTGRTAAGQATLAATIAAAPTPQAPNWQYGIFGTNIGASGILFADNNGVRETYVGGSARGGFSSDDFWQVLTWDPTIKGYQQKWVSLPFTSPLRRLAIGNVSDNPGNEIVAASEDGMLVVYRLSDKAELSRLKVVSGLRQMRLFDIDGNGTDEILVTTDSDLYCYSNAGTQLWKVTGAGGADFVIANMDNDPGLEVAVTSGKVVDVATRTIQWTYASGFGSILRAYDVDGDGKAELISSAGWYQVYCYDVDLMVPKWSIPTDLDVGAIELANVDSDPMPELLIGDGQWGEIHAFDLTTRTQQWQISNPEHGVTQVAVSDVDGDGKLDVLWGAGATSTGPDYLYVADIATLTRKWQNVHLDGPFLSPVIGDVDGDGKPELVTCTYESGSGYDSGRILVFDAETRALRGISAPVCNNSSWTGVRDLRLRDIDGDGALDIVIATDWLYDGTIEIYGFSKQNVFSKKWTNAVRPSGTFTSADVADVDGDGKLEVVAGSSAVRFYDLATSQLEWQSVQLGTMSDLRIADIDHDGHLEVLALVSGQNVTVLDGQLHATEAQITGNFTSLAVAADGSKFYAGTATGSIAPYSWNGTGYSLGAVWSASSSRIDGITLDGTDFWICSAGQLSWWSSPSVRDWLSVDFGDVAGPRVAVVPNGIGRTVYLGTQGTLAGFNAQPPIPKPTVSITGNGTLREGNSTGATLVISLSIPAPQALSIKFSTSGTASTSDYSIQGAQAGANAGEWVVPFALGETTHTVTVNAVDDALAELTENLDAQLISSTGYVLGSSSTASISIEDNESTVSIATSAGASLAEGNTQPVALVVSLAQPAAAPVAVRLTTSGTASSQDYLLQGAQAGENPGEWLVSFAEGESTHQVVLTAVDDQECEPTESIDITIGSSTHYFIAGDPSVTVAIEDDEPTISVAATDSEASEERGVRTSNVGVINLHRSGSLAKPLNVRYELGGTAMNGKDYRLLSGFVTFNPGKSDVEVHVVPLRDRLAEPTEDVLLSLMPSARYRIDPESGSASVAILDNAPTVELGSAKMDSNIWGSFAAFSFVRNSSGLETPLTALYLVTRTFVDGSQITAVGSVHFAAKQSTARAILPPYGFGTRGDEVVTVELLDAPSYHLGGNLENSMSLSAKPSAP